MEILLDPHVPFVAARYRYEACVWPGTGALVFTTSQRSRATRSGRSTSTPGDRIALGEAHLQLRRFGYVSLVLRRRHLCSRNDPDVLSVAVHATRENRHRAGRHDRV